MMDQAAFRRRMALSRQIRATLSESMDADQAARWLRCEADQIIREAKRKAKPLERFPIDADAPEAAF